MSGRRRRDQERALVKPAELDDGSSVLDGTSASVPGSFLPPPLPARNI